MLAQQDVNMQMSYALNLDDLVQQLEILLQKSDDVQWLNAFFRMPRIRDLFQSLDNFVRHDEGIIFVNGPKDIGKTSLLKACAKSWQDDPQLLCSLKLSQKITNKIKTASLDDILNTIRTWRWGSMAIAPKRLILLFDDFEFFSKDDLERLETVLHSSIPAVDRIVAVAFGCLETKSGNFQKLLDTHHLKSITFNTYTLMDVEILLFNYLRKFGVPSTTHVFSHDVLEWLCTQSQGLPGKVLKLANALLQLGARKGFEFIDWSIVDYFQSQQLQKPKKSTGEKKIIQPKQNFALDIFPEEAIKGIIDVKNGKSKNNTSATLAKDALNNKSGLVLNIDENQKTDQDSLSQEEIDKLMAGLLPKKNLNDPHQNAKEPQDKVKAEDDAEELTQELLDRLINDYERQNSGKKQKQIKQSQRRFSVKTKSGKWNPLPLLDKKSLFARKAKNIICMDIGTNAIKFLLADPSGEIKHIKIVSISKEAGKNIARGKFSKDDKEQVAASLANFSRSVEAEDSDIIISLSGKYYLSINLSFPNMPLKELENAIKFEIEGKHNLFPNREKIIRFKVQDSLTNSSEEINVFCTVIQKEIVDQLVELTHELGFNLRLLTANSIAIHNYLLQTGILDDVKTTVVIDLGAHISEILIVQGAYVLLTQTINVGSFALNQAISDALMVDYGLAEEFKIKIGSGIIPQGKKAINTTDNLEVYEALLPVLEQLDGEIGRTIEAHRLRHPEAQISEIILAGGGSLLYQLDTRISSTFSLPVIRLQTPHGLEGSENCKNIQEILPSLGLMSSYSNSKDTINFLQELKNVTGKKKATFSQKRQQTFTVNSSANKWLRRAFIIALALVAGFISLNFYLKNMQNQLFVIEAKLSDEETKMKELDALLAKNRALAEQIDIIKSLMHNRIRYSETLSMILKLKPQDIGIANISMLDGRLVIEGTAKNSGSFPNFLKSLDNLPGFEQPELRYVNKNKDLGINYQIVCKPKNKLPAKKQQAVRQAIPLLERK